MDLRFENLVSYERSKALDVAGTPQDAFENLVSYKKCKTTYSHPKNRFVFLSLERFNTILKVSNIIYNRIIHFQSTEQIFDFVLYFF